MWAILSRIFSSPAVVTATAPEFVGVQFGVLVAPNSLAEAAFASARKRNYATLVAHAYVGSGWHLYTVQADRLDRSAWDPFLIQLGSVREVYA